MSIAQNSLRHESAPPRLISSLTAFRSIYIFAFPLSAYALDNLTGGIIRTGVGQVRRVTDVIKPLASKPAQHKRPAKPDQQQIKSDNSDIDLGCPAVNGGHMECTMTIQRLVACAGGAAEGLGAPYGDYQMDSSTEIVSIQKRG